VRYSTVNHMSGNNYKFIGQLEGVINICLINLNSVECFSVTITTLCKQMRFQILMATIMETAVFLAIII
jgi:hypothetical protein